MNELEKLIKETIKAIENGQITNDHRVKFYTQEFGEAFLNMLKSAIKKS